MSELGQIITKPFENKSLLTQQDGPPLEIINPDGHSPIVLICEHASNYVPQMLENLGLTAEQLDAHIGWDKGAFALAEYLSQTLDAPLIAARFSRLVYDCNRPPEADSAMPHKTEHCDVPLNANLTAQDRQIRANEIYHPFHAAISDVLKLKRQTGHRPIIITVHSFTPVFNGQKRDVEIGFLHGDDDCLSKAMAHHMARHTTYNVKCNEPYAPTDGVLHTIEKHLQNDVFPYVMIEVRSDLLTDHKEQNNIFSTFAKCIPLAVSSLDADFHT